MSSVDVVPVAENKQLEEPSINPKSTDNLASLRVSDEVKPFSDMDTTTSTILAPVKNPWSKIKSQTVQGK